MSISFIASLERQTGIKCFAVVLILFVISSCGTSVNRDTTRTINAGLDYLWRDDRSGNLVQVRPGMKLTLRSLPLLNEGRNQTVPSLSSYEWIVPSPSAPLTREDVLFANFLAVSGIVEGQSAAPIERELEKRAKELCSNNQCLDGEVATKYVDQILTPLFSTLRVRHFHRWGNESPANKYSVQSIKRRACEPSAGLLGPSEEPTGTLVFSFESKSYQVLGFEDFFFHGSPKRVSREQLGSSELYRPSVDENRGFVDVSIPVRLGRESQSVYFPVCTSISDVEAMLGREVWAVRRNAVFLPRDATGTPLIHSRVTDGYFTVWFGGPGAPQDAYSAPDLKPEILVGAGDVLVFSSKRLTRSDAPTPVWQ